MLVYVTGATGLLGSAVVAQLVERGHGVRALVRDPAKATSQLPAGAEVVVGDLDDLPSVLAPLDGVDAVIHTAAYFREYFGAGDHEAVLQRRNVDVPVALLREAARRGVTTVVHTSSSGVVGPGPDGGPGDEAAPPPRLAPSTGGYFASKVRAERALEEAAAGLPDVRLVLARPGWMFGPRDAAPTGAGQLVLDISAGRVPALPRSARPDLTDARDVAAAMVTAIEQGFAGRVNLTARPTPLTAVAGLIADAATVRAPRPLPDALLMAFAAGVETVARVTGGRPLVTRKALVSLSSGASASSDLARRELAFRPRPVADTIRDTVAWYREAGRLPQPPAAAPARAA